MTVPVKTGSPGPLSTGIDSPGQRRLVDARPPGQNRPVNRHTLSGSNEHQIARDDLDDRDLPFHPVATDTGRPGGLVEQAVDLALGPGEGDSFENLAYQGDEDDLRRHERLADDDRGHAGLSQRDVGADPAFGESLDRPVDDPDRAQDRRDPGQRDPQRCPQRLPTQPAEDQVAADQKAEDRRERIERARVVVVVLSVMLMVVVIPVVSEGVRPEVMHVGRVVFAMHAACSALL